MTSHTMFLLLEAIGLDETQIAQHYGANLQNEQQAIQDGLIAWINSVDPTWEELLDAMEAAGIGLTACNALKEKLQQ